MTIELLPSDDLAAMFEMAWQALAAAVVDPNSPFRWPVVATVGLNGPSARLMVLRSVDRKARTLSFYTDRRAKKVGEVIADPRVAITGYDPEARLQLRFYGMGNLRTGSAVADRWHAIGDSGRRAYATIQAPGSRLDAAGSGLPGEIAHADGEANFAVFEVTVTQFEWLELASSGHRRARYEYLDEVWAGCWRVP